MILLDEPYASDGLLAWMEETGHPVLANDFTRGLARVRNLNLVDDDEAARRIDGGERVYTNSENALAWLLDRTANEGLRKGIRVFKDKALMRRELAELDPQLLFRTVSFQELQDLDPATLPMPFVLKPSVGFCSMGVYTVQTPEDFAAAVRDIRESAARWQARYPGSVIGVDEYILEGYVDGQEYAVDAYFDGEGRARVLNVLQHDFAGPEDTSDRLYFTSGPLVGEMAPLLARWLDRVGAILGLSDFPVHVEVRVKEGHVTPIEFNPLRFAGLGGTDVSHYAFGYWTFQRYLEDDPVDLEEVARNADGAKYTMGLLGIPAAATGEEPFDYDGFASRFDEVLEMRRFDAAKVGSYGFLFARVEPDREEQLDYLLNADLRGFLG